MTVIAAMGLLRAYFDRCFAHSLKIANPEELQRKPMFPFEYEQSIQNRVCEADFCWDAPLAGQPTLERW